MLFEGFERLLLLGCGVDALWLYEKTHSFRDILYYQVI